MRIAPRTAWAALLLSAAGVCGGAVTTRRLAPASVSKAADGRPVIRFDLSGVPAAAALYRADLRIPRTKRLTGNDDEALVGIEIFPLLAAFKAGAAPGAKGPALKLRGPWFDSFDAAGAVRAWTAGDGGKPNGGFHVRAGPFLDPAAARLDVTFEGAPAGKLPPQVAGVKVFHRSGQTFITWREIDDPIGADEVRWGKFREVLKGLDKPREVRYCVYRHTAGINAGNLHQAELLARVRPLSCWNVNGRNLEKAIDDCIADQYAMIHGHWNPWARASMDGKYGRDYVMERLVIHDGPDAAPLPRGTGLYVHTATKKAAAHYAVIACIDGVANTTGLSAANAPPAPVAEAPADPEPVFQKVIPDQPYWNYPETKRHYVRWVGPPHVNRPSQYYNWLVAVPDRHGKTMPLELSLHRDDRSYYRTQYRIERDSIVVTPHDFPIKTWWYGYHESLGTLKSFRQGRIHPYTERRVLSFLDWVCRTWPVDRARILVTAVRRSAAGAGRYGRGGGSSGALHLGIRHPKVFNMVLSGGGIADYAGHLRARRAAGKPDKAVERELQAIWGKLTWDLPTASGHSVWNAHDLTRIVKAAPVGLHMPLVTVTSGGILKPQRDFYEAMLEAGQPIMARFGVYGGGKLLPVSASGTWPGIIRQDVRRDRPMACFRGRGASVLGGPPKKASGPLVISDGVRYWFGGFNTHFRWRTEDLVESPARLEITLYRVGGKGKFHFASLAIRRLTKFRPREGYKYRWEYRNADGEVEMGDKGEIVAKDGVFFLPALDIVPDGRRLIIHP